MQPNPSKSFMGPGHAPLSGQSGGLPGWDLLLVIAGALILVSSARLHVFIPGLSAVRPGLLLVVAGTALWLSKGDPLRRLGRPIPLGVKLGVFVLAWAVVGVPFALWPGQSGRGVAEAFGVAVLVFLLVVASVRHVADVRRLLGVTAVGAGIFAVMGPIQGRIPIRGFGAGGYDPNDSAMFLVATLPTLVLFAISSKRWSIRLLAGLGALMALLAVVQTQSRGGFLGLAAVLLFIFLFFRGIRTVAKVAAVGLLAVGLAVTADADYWDRMSTITEMDDGYGVEGSVVGGRRQIWTRGMGYMFENPLTGVGLFNFAVAEGQSREIAEQIRRGFGAKFSAAHSMWVQVGAELGIPGFLAFIGLFGHVGWRMWKISRRRSRWRTDRETSLMASTILATIIGVAVPGSFLSNAYWPMVWLPLALGIALARLDDEESRSRRQATRQPVAVGRNGGQYVSPGRTSGIPVRRW